jgi:hypothetical protein
MSSNVCVLGRGGWPASRQHPVTPTPTPTCTPTTANKQTNKQTNKRTNSHPPPSCRRRAGAWPPAAPPPPPSGSACPVCCNQNKTVCVCCVCVCMCVRARHGTVPSRSPPKPRTHGHNGSQPSSLLPPLHTPPNTTNEPNPAPSCHLRGTWGDRFQPPRVHANNTHITGHRQSRPLKLAHSSHLRVVAAGLRGVGREEVAQEGGAPRQRVVHLPVDV